MARVDIIIPTYNREKYLREAINSVLNQTYQDYKIIVIDDGSTDNTREIMEKYVTNYPNRIKYFYQMNKGPSAARNKGIAASQAMFIAFLDSDDMWYPEKLEVQISFLERNPQFSMCFSESEVINANGNTVYFTNLRKSIPRDGWILKYILQKPSIFTPSVIIRRNVFSSIGTFDESMGNIGEDTDLFLRVALNFQVCLIERPLIKCRIHEQNISFDPLAYGYRIQIYKRFLRQNKLFHKQNKRLIAKIFAEIYLKFAEILINNNQEWNASIQIGKHFIYGGTSIRGTILFVKCVLKKLLPRSIYSLFIFLKTKLLKQDKIMRKP